MVAAPLSAVKSPESQLDSTANLHFSGWIFIARGEESPLPLLYGLVWHSENTLQEKVGMTEKIRGRKVD